MDQEKVANPTTTKNENLFQGNTAANGLQSKCTASIECNNVFYKSNQITASPSLWLHSISKCFALGFHIVYKMREER